METRRRADDRPLTLLSFWGPVVEMAPRPATTALMLVFVMRLARLAAAERVGAPSGRLWSWAALAVAALLIPWLMFAAVGSPAEALEPAKLWDAIWPMLIGVALALGLWPLATGCPASPPATSWSAGLALLMAALALARG
jgi:hypothetical protein